MTPSQMTLYFTVLVILIILGFELVPRFEGAAVRRALAIGGGIFVIAALVISLVFTPSFLLWIEYALISVLVFAGLWAYNQWVREYLRSRFAR